MLVSCSGHGSYSPLGDHPRQHCTVFALPCQSMSGCLTVLTYKHIDMRLADLPHQKSWTLAESMHKSSGCSYYSSGSSSRSRSRSGSSNSGSSSSSSSSSSGSSSRGGGGSSGFSVAEASNSSGTGVKSRAEFAKASGPPIRCLGLSALTLGHDVEGSGPTGFVPTW